MEGKSTQQIVVSWSFSPKSLAPESTTWDTSHPWHLTTQTLYYAFVQRCNRAAGAGDKRGQRWSNDAGAVPMAASFMPCHSAWGRGRLEGHFQYLLNLNGLNRKRTGWWINERKLKKIVLWYRLKDEPFYGIIQYQANEISWSRYTATLSQLRTNTAVVTSICQPLSFRQHQIPLDAKPSLQLPILSLSYNWVTTL